MLFEVTAWLLASMFFYPALIISFLLLWSFSEKSRGTWAFFMAVIFGYLLIAKFPEILAIASNPYLLGSIIVGYIVAAALWGRFKWYLVLSKVRDTFLEGRAIWERETGMKADIFTGPDRDLPETKALEKRYVQTVAIHLNHNKISSQRYIDRRDDMQLTELVKLITPQASQNKADIVMWMAYWPLSILWFLVSDFVVTIGEEIYRRVATSFQKMSDSKFNDLS